MRDLKIVLITLLVVVLLISGVTVYKVIKEHQELELLVTTKKITEAAMNCYWDDVCTGSMVSLGNLINYGYLSETVNPITKLYYSHDSYVLVNNNTYTFYEVV